MSVSAYRIIKKMIRLKHTFKTGFLALGILASLAIITSKPVVFAETIKCADNSVHEVAESDTAADNIANLCASSGGIKTGETVKSGNGTGDPSCSAKGKIDQCVLFTKYLIPLINLLTAGVGLVITIMIVIGGIQYTSSGGNAQAVTAAKQRIFNSLLALFAFAFMWSFLQFVVPGGLFK